MTQSRTQKKTIYAYVHLSMSAFMLVSLFCLSVASWHCTAQCLRCYFTSRPNRSFRPKTIGLCVMTHSVTPLIVKPKISKCITWKLHLANKTTHYQWWKGASPIPEYTAEDLILSFHIWWTTGKHCSRLTENITSTPLTRTNRVFSWLPLLTSSCDFLIGLFKWCVPECKYIIVIESMGDKGRLKALLKNWLPGAHYWILRAVKEGCVLHLDLEEPFAIWKVLW